MAVIPLQSNLNHTLDRIVLARIDNRLVHGQVLEAWVPFVQANGIVVASDEVDGKPLQKKLMAASVPSDTPIIISGLAEIAEFFSRNEGATRILLLFPSPAAALRGYRLGIPFSELNLGNISSSESKHRLSCSISLSDDDMDDLQTLEGLGVRVAVRCLPSDQPMDWKVLARGGEE